LEFDFSKFLSREMKSLSLMNKSMEIKIGNKRFWVHFSKIWKIGAIYKANKIGDKIKF